MILVLTIIAMASAAVLSLTYQLTYGPIQESRARVLHDSIFTVLPGSVDVAVLEHRHAEGIEEDQSTLRSRPGTDASLLLYQGLDESGDPVGFAYVSEGAGYGGIIKVMVGVGQASEAITGIAILEHVETSGIGDKIEEESFRNQFIGKTVNDSIAIGQDIDNITGSTVSASAVTAAVRSDLAYTLEAYREASNR